MKCVLKLKVITSTSKIPAEVCAQGNVKVKVKVNLLVKLKLIFRTSQIFAQIYVQGHKLNLNVYLK